MSEEHLEDLTVVFTRLQSELEPAGIGEKTSLEVQLKNVEADLQPFFLNADNLSAGLGSGGLTYEHAFLKRTKDWSYPHLVRLLGEYRAAQKADQAALFAVLAAFLPQMDSAYRHVVSIAELEADKANLKGYTLARSCLRDMGDLIESTLRPFLSLRLKVLQISGEFSAGSRRIDDLSLGTLVSALTTLDPDLYALTTFNIPLSQWRNISHHSSYKSVGDKIICEYGPPGRRGVIECSPMQLIELFIEVETLYYLHKVGFEIFCTDNIHALSAGEKETGTKVTLSELSTNAILAYGIVASGFHIARVARRAFRWGVFLIDRHDRERTHVEAALQRALVPYLLHSGPTQIYAWVESKRGQQFVSFQGELKRSSDLKSGEYAEFKMDGHFRINEGTSEDGAQGSR